MFGYNQAADVYILCECNNWHCFIVGYTKNIIQNESGAALVFYLGKISHFIYLIHYMHIEN